MHLGSQAQPRIEAWMISHILNRNGWDAVGLTGAQSPQEHWPNPAALTQVSRLSSNPKLSSDSTVLSHPPLNGKDSPSDRLSSEASRSASTSSVLSILSFFWQAWPQAWVVKNVDRNPLSEMLQLYAEPTTQSSWTIIADGETLQKGMIRSDTSTAWKLCPCKYHCGLTWFSFCAK